MNTFDLIYPDKSVIPYKHSELSTALIDRSYAISNHEFVAEGVHCLSIEKYV